MEETLETATKEGADRDYYEAHAVLLNIKRKQMDSAGGMLEIARATKDTELRRAATAFGKAQKAELPGPRRGARLLRGQDRDLHERQGRPMTDERRPSDPVEDTGSDRDGRDRSDRVDVVEGPIGAAHLVEPSDIPESGNLDAFPEFEDVTADHRSGDDRDKDILRGGSGERGEPTDPATNDDLLGGGSGESSTGGS